MVSKFMFGIKTKKDQRLEIYNMGASRRGSLKFDQLPSGQHHKSEDL
jgi:hypothetical protein